MSRVTLFVALLFGVLSPVRAAPNAAESEELELWGDAAESESAVHARVTTRHARRTPLQGGPAHADIELVRASVRATTSTATLARPRWQLPRRAAPPDEDPLG